MVSSTEETPAQRPQSLARLLTSATSNLTKLQADIEQRDRDLSQKLDAIKNGALEDLKVEKKIDEIISDMSKLWQQQKKTQMLLESLSNQTSAAAAAATAADKPISSVINSAAKFTKQVLDRRLLILGKSAALRVCNITLNGYRYITGDYYFCKKKSNIYCII